VFVDAIVARQHIDHQLAQVGELRFARERRHPAIQPERTAAAQELLEVAEGLEVGAELAGSSNRHVVWLAERRDEIGNQRGVRRSARQQARLLLRTSN
jgi:hypothetical protein